MDDCNFNLYNKCLLIVFFLSGIFLGRLDLVVDEVDKNSCVYRDYILVGKISNNDD